MRGISILLYSSTLNDDIMSRCPFPFLYKLFNKRLINKTSHISSFNQNFGSKSDIHSVYVVYNDNEKWKDNSTSQYYRINYLPGNLKVDNISINLTKS
ncbi:unnamed protein product [Rhizophagus irregularis]|nr:unnamed protein product [Rhizophagus irregularis]